MSNFLIQEWTFTPPDPEKLPSIPSSVSIVTYRYMYWHILHLSHSDIYVYRNLPFITHWHILHLSHSGTCIYRNILHLLQNGTYSICHSLVYTGIYSIYYTLEHTLFVTIWYIPEYIPFITHWRILHLL